MNFQQYKLLVLSRKDNSNKGSIDKPILDLINTINKHKDYCTTSSCSGRTVIYKPKDKKNEIDFEFVSHEEISEEQTENIEINQGIWFRFEPLILHVTCSSLESAQTLLNISRTICKHSGVISLGKYPIIEIRGSEFIEAPLTKETIKVLVSSANNKLKRTHKKIFRLTDLIKKLD